MMKFTKMHGAGNDYIYFDCTKATIPNPNKLSLRLSDRHFSVGGDGIVLICPSQTADFRMRMFNADGSEGKMCGNAIRCVAKYVFDRGLTNKEQIKIETLSGIKTIDVKVKDNKVVAATVDMGRATGLEDGETTVEAGKGEFLINHPLDVNGTVWMTTTVSMGNPHCVTFVPDVHALKLDEIGPSFENHPVFPERINTEFVHVIDRNTLDMRVWERGSGETLACGTGACAAVAAAVLNGYVDSDSDVIVHLLGGDLTIRYTGDTVWMTGEAVEVFTGEIEVE